MHKGNLIINDPVYGFINIPRGLLSRIIEHPWFQRLGRIHQLGMASMVYPGAQHTRKQHSLGAYHLMQEALLCLVGKGHFIFDSEIEAAEAAILLHDIGHGPYSHVLESVFVKGLTHEQLSLAMMRQMNEEFRGELTLAIKIFQDEYPKHFLHELICSQLDMDRLDYLCRDSFYTGVIEGNIGAARIIKTLDLSDDRLVVNQKGIYSVENYLMARRLMYWQVYLHKTAVGAEQLLRSALRRAKCLANNGIELFATSSLHYFLYHNIDANNFFSSDEALERYADLDDSDILVSLKAWSRHPDKVLSILSTSFIERRLFKTEIYEGSLPQGLLEDLRRRTAEKYALSYEDTGYFVSVKTIEKEMYTVCSEGIGMLYPDGKVKDVSEVSNIVRSDNCEMSDSKLYVFYPDL